MMKIKHKYLLQCLGKCRSRIKDDKYLIFIFMEEYNGGSLFDFQNGRKNSLLAEREI